MQKHLFRFITLLLLPFCFTGGGLGKNQDVTIGEIRYNGRFPTKKSELSKIAGVRAGARFEPGMLPEIAVNLERWFLSNGYLFARIDSLSLAYSRDSTRVNIAVHGTSGNLVRVGEITVVSDSLSPETYHRQRTLNSSDVYDRRILEEDLHRLLNVAADSGYLHARAGVEAFRIRSEENENLAAFTIRIRESERVRVDEIRFRGNSYTRNEVLLREIGIKPAMYYSRQKVERIPEQLSRLGLLKQVYEPVIVVREKSSVALLIEVVEGNTTTFDGVVGYIPEESVVTNKSGYFTGLIDLSLNNLFGTGRKFNVHWKKPDRDSEEFSLDYLEPWVGGYPLDLGTGLERAVRDTSFIEWKYELNYRIRVYENLNIVGRLRRKLAFPDSAASRRLGITRNAVLEGETGLEYDSRDYPVNPRDGIYYRNTYSYGRKENFGPSYLLQEQEIKKNEALETIRLNFEWIQGIVGNQVLAVALNGYKVSGNRLQLTDYFWFGGSRSLRGYRENQFRGSIVAWTNLEYRFLLGRNSRLFLFNDWGFYKRKTDGVNRDTTLPGYGLGIRIDTGLGILGVDYGLGRGDSFNRGKIHFGIINRF